MMAKKRKRNNHNTNAKKENKNEKKKNQNESAISDDNNNNRVEHAVLSRYFPCLLRLREYFVYLLRTWSSESIEFRAKCASVKAYTSDGSPESDEVAWLLDTAIVCLPRPIETEMQSSKGDKDLSELTCIAEESGLESSQTELVELVVELLFRRALPKEPTSILTRGYNLNKDKFPVHAGGGMKRFGIEVVITCPNLVVGKLRSAAWNLLRDLVGEKAMMALLLMQGAQDGGLFMQVVNDNDDSKNTGKCYIQLAGDALCQREKLKLDTLKPQEKKAAKSLKRRNDWESPLAQSTPPVAKKLKLSEVKESKKNENKTTTNTSQKDANAAILRKPGAITFYRMRMFYAKPVLNKEGEVKFGLRHIHALNRFSDHNLRAHRTRILKYIFPREFNLHNVFTSKINRAETTQPLQDYTVREKEINTHLAGIRNKKFPQPDIIAPYYDDDLDSLVDGGSPPLVPLTEIEKNENIPKRLRGKMCELAGKLIRNNKRCSYHALLKHYCPVSFFDPGVREKRPVMPKAVERGNDTSLAIVTQLQKVDTTVSILKDSPIKYGRRESQLEPQDVANPEVPEEGFTDFASTAVEVSAFCRAAVKNVFPHEFWGSKEKGIHNLRMVERKIDRFVKLRKFESITLHEMIQDFKITDFAWLGEQTCQKLTLSDTNKRVSLLSEFFYYLFDSFVIPLIQSHFYATESNANRNRVFYFRHDVWKKLTEPKLCDIKTSMFEEMPTHRANRILLNRDLGFGMIRLLPKADGVRMITNMKRRVMVKDRKTGKLVLGSNINSVLAPVHQALKYEIGCDPTKLGSSLFSVGDLHPKLKAFRRFLESRNILGNQKIYLVKVDVKKCFDTIPHRGLLDFVKETFSEEEYKNSTYAEITETLHKYGNGTNTRWVSKSVPGDEYPDLDEQATKWQTDPKFSQNKSTVFVDLVWQKFKDKSALEDTLQEHVMHNLIKIGKKYYRQKSGIPQGSVLSTILCNLFYADLEEKHLPFTREPDGLLLRLIDDFLYLTLNRSHAEQFLRLMHKGFPEYGAFVNPDKSLVNFDVSVAGKIINRVFESDGGFPYCGTRICEKTLDVKRDKRKPEANVIEDTLTVEYSHNAGKSMVKKALNYLTRSARTVYFDTSFNSRRTVLQNLYCSYVEAAMRLYRYGKNLGPKKRPSEKFIIAAIEEITELSFILLNNRKTKPTTPWSQEAAGKAKQQAKQQQQREYTHIHTHNHITNKNKTHREQDSIEFDIDDGFKCVVGKSQIRWLAAAAFHRVYRRKQTLYGAVLHWLESRMADKKNARVDRSCRRIPDGKEMREFLAGFKY